MIVSRNEIEGLALKAARGAGMSWGLAEEAGVAAVWLAERMLPWAETLVGILARQEAASPPRIVGHAILPSRAGSYLCPVLTGALLSDLGAAAHMKEVHEVLGPLWLAAFLARQTGPDRAVRLSWAEVAISLGGAGLSGPVAAEAAALAAPFANRVEIAFEPARTGCAAQPYGGAGCLVPDDAWRALQALEHRTYVPASAHSRLSGAGAGLLDND